MPRGGRFHSHKRKRSGSIEYSSFPEEKPLQCRTGLRTVGTAASLSEAWLKCGEGFQDTPGTQSLTTGRVTLTEKDLELATRPKKETTTSKNTSEPTDITWSSSGSDLSDEDKTLSKSQRDNEHGSRIDRFITELFCVQKVGPVKPIFAEILEYSSDSHKEDDSENVLFIDSESPHKYHMEYGSDARQVMDRLSNPRLKSETVLGTPQKQTAKFPRTPENSAKKKKLLRGGLAERLTRLQNRERSAISLWRHQHVSYQKTISGTKSGVLTVKILELHEECTMQVAMCEQLVGSPAAIPSRGVATGPETNLKVLFTQETACYLRGCPQDVIHIFPPWQKLIIPNGGCPIILNTYFCQKVFTKEDSETTHKLYCHDVLLPRRNITLAQMFKIKDLSNNSPESQVVYRDLATTGKDWTNGPKKAKQHFTAESPFSDSLLDVVESQGASPWSGVGVQVVVQRVYSLPGRDGTGSQQESSSGHADPPEPRICLLVQDAYGMFGEVYLEVAMLKGKQLEGKSCQLAGMKVLQKTTRGRTPGLFSLIDTIWRPAIPLKSPGHGQPCEEVKTHLPPPSFCYILSAHPNLGQIDMIEGDPISKLYQPPVLLCLRDILQTDNLGARCSFYARVIYQRPQLKSLLLLAQREIWLLVTDITLQTKDGNDHHLPKILPVCVTPSCVLGLEILEALSVAAPHSILFRDALRDQAGQIVCVERTVLLLQKPFGCVASGAGSCELTGPVILDELDSLTPVNSICSVQGTVVGVDENTAFSWPTCDWCGNGRLEQRPEDGGTFFCGDCSKLITSPVLKRHLQVFLDCPSRPQCNVKVKLLQGSISSLLRFAACEDGTYEVKSVLGKEVGLLSCFVHSITTHPTNFIGLEEIEILSAGGTSAEGQRLQLDL
ncbi:DNA repair-scaffolding protein isoform X1 [Sciurus carolinensis]|uniref:DNA repair-scaffolding protein isoform X1 n=2 Tax=Sciurus carolinensis TaxID=30640 RepID=UPI001FB2A9D8|nr:DNA repair-scaffolding protein isoform X1 [Sciurus carolinensis]